MARDSKGQQVKTFKHYVPGPDLKGVETIGKVYFKPDDGRFYIHVPAHIRDYLPSSLDGWETRDTWHGRAGYVTSTTMDKALAGYHAVLAAYTTRRRNDARSKVIRVAFKANHPGRSEYTQGRLEGISFCGRPALFIDHEVLWRVGDACYRITKRDMEAAEKDNSVPHMAWVCAMPGKEHYPQRTQSTFIIDWTEEREAFFERMHSDMTRLIEMCMAMLFGNTGGNVDAIIANGGVLSIAATAALPAPDFDLAPKPEAVLPPARTRTRGYD